LALLDGIDPIGPQGGHVSYATGLAKLDALLAPLLVSVSNQAVLLLDFLAVWAVIVIVIDLPVSR